MDEKKIPLAIREIMGLGNMEGQYSSSQQKLTDPAQWVEQHGDALYRYALSRLGKPEIAEDLVQETFLAAMRAKDRFAGESSGRSWLVAILKHKLIDYLRRKGRETPATDVGQSDDVTDSLFDQNGSWKVRPSTWGDDPQKLVERQDFWNVFQGCLAGLPARLAHAFVLREMEDLSTDEIRDALNVSATNLGVLLHRARMRLRRCLEINWFSTQAD